MTARDDIAFLSYFFRSYIPPFTKPMPMKEEEYEDIFLSAYEIWGHLRGDLDRMPLPYDIKKNMVDLFTFSKELWMTYLLATEPYRHLILKSEIRDKWRKMEYLAKNIDSYYKSAPEFE